MRHQLIVTSLVFIASLTSCEDSDNNQKCLCDTGSGSTLDTAAKQDTKTPKPDGSTVNKLYSALRQLLQDRHSANAYTSKPSFSTKPLTKDDIATMLWAGQGVNRPGLPTGRATAKGLRTAPSAGALYPIELYVAVDNVTGVNSGLYWYRPEKDTFEATAKTGKLASIIAGAALNQQVIKQAAAIFIITAVGQRTAQKYGSRGEAYIWVEMGHVGQNILLMAQARDIESRPVAAFDMKKMSTALGLPADHAPGYLIPVGKKP